jgi:hypothetical protein
MTGPTVGLIMSGGGARAAYQYGSRFPRLREGRQVAPALELGAA